MKGEMPVQLLVSLVLLRVVYEEGLMGTPTGGKLAASGTPEHGRTSTARSIKIHMDGRGPSSAHHTVSRIKVA